MLSRHSALSRHPAIHGRGLAPFIRSISALAATLLATTAAVPVLAQTQPVTASATPSSGGLEEIVVTAQRREEKLHNVPIAVTALTAANIEARGITNIKDLSGFAPNVSFVQSPSFDNETTVAIRGGVTINPAPYWEPAVGMYVDGVYIDKAQGNVFDLVDLDHIEVLRGPQGTPQHALRRGEPGDAKADRRFRRRRAGEFRRLRL